MALITLPGFSFGGIAGLRSRPFHHRAAWLCGALLLLASGVRATTCGQMVSEAAFTSLLSRSKALACWLLTFLACLASAPVQSQSSTNACGFTAGAQYTVGASCNPVAFNKPNGYTNSMNPGTCNSGNYDDAFGWFAGTGNPVTVQYTPPGGGDAVLHVFSGTCAAPVELGCSDACCGGAVESVTVPTTVGTNYIVRVQRYGSNSAMNGTLCLVNSLPATNDDPCGAVNLPVNTTCVNTNATNANTTATTGVPAPTCANYQGGDVWFSLTVPAGGSVTVSTTAGVVTDGGMALYNATSCSGTFTQIACNDDANGLMPAITANGLSPGSTVYVRFWEYGNDNNGTFSICATMPPPPPGNNGPCGAVNLTVNPDLACGVQTAGTLNGATASGLATAPCFGTPDNDVWFSFTATGPVHYISLNNVAGNTTDLYHAVYSGSNCNSLTNISCSDPDNSVLSGLTPGNTYWVRVYSYFSGPANTTFDVCVGTPPPPPGCGQVFYDSGGPSGNYTNYENTVTTICATNPGDLVSLLFTSFHTEFIDDLTIYDGNSTAAPVIGTYNGTTLPPYILASNASGCLTAEFYSDGSITYEGWAANVDCHALPAGDCVYVLEMHDSGGNGWGSSMVRVRINGGAWTNYTVTGSGNAALIGVNIGDLFEAEYIATGPNQGQNSYTISRVGQNPYFSSAIPPVAGITFSQTVSCGPPPAQPQDCVGGITICDDQAITNTSTSTGDVMDLNSSNEGCLAAGERQGTWYYFSPQTNGTIGFSIAPANGTDDYDFALWGPFANAQCPTGPPLRCSFNAPPSYTVGLGNGATDVSEGAGGDGWVSTINVQAGEVYVLYIDNYSTTGQAFTLNWQLSGGSSLDCTTLPVELISLEATARDPVVDVTWATATELNSHHFTVERSPDNSTFAPIGTVPAAGNAQFRNDYLFVDQNPFRGVNYYRLEQVDNDGTTMRSYTVVATLSDGDGSPSIYPNPAADVLNVVFPHPPDGPLELEVRNALGRTAAKFRTEDMPARRSLRIAIGSLAPGWYSLRINLPGGGMLNAGQFLKKQGQ